MGEEKRNEETRSEEGETAELRSEGAGSEGSGAEDLRSEEPEAEATRPEEAGEEAGGRPRERLYFTPNFKRFFAVPRDAELPEGELEVVSLADGLRKLDEAALAEHEITPEEARQRFQQRVDAFFQEASRWLGRGTGVLRDAAGKVKPEREALDRAIRPLAEALGIGPDELRENPDALFEGLKERAAAWSRSLKEALEPPEDAKEKAREQWRSFSDTLRREGAVAAEEVERLAATLRAALERPEVKERLRQARRGIRSFFEQLASALDEEVEAERAAEEAGGEAESGADGEGGSAGESGGDTGGEGTPGA